MFQYLYLMNLLTNLKAIKTVIVYVDIKNAKLILIF